MSYELLKTAHIISAILLFGTGLGSAFYKYFTDRTDNLAAIHETNRLVVLADWLFTTPTVILQPLTGFLLLYVLGMDWREPWVLASLGLYALAGACWLPVVWLQIEMRNMSGAAVQGGTALPACYHNFRRIWFWLGVPAFVSMVAVVSLMVFKPVFW